MKEIGATKEEIEGRGGQVKAFAIAIVGAIVAVFVLAILVQVANATEALEGLAIGLLVGVGFVVTTMGINYTFEARSVRILLINAGYPVLNLAVVGTILGVWQ